MSELADYAWLTGPEAKAVLNELAEDDSPLLRQLDRLRKVLSVSRSRLAVEQAGLRRRAIDKFGSRAAQMFFTDLTLQQATDRWIAEYKSSRFSAEHAVLDLCTGIGGDLIALAQRGSTIGWERSPELALLAEANLRACGVGGQIHVGDVAELSISKNDWWHLDPDRRSDGRRSTHVEWHSPGLEVIERMRTAAQHGALKLAPAAQPPPDWQETAECEWISRDRECRQLVVWFGQLAATPGQRRATVITTSPDDGVPPTASSFVGYADLKPQISASVGDYVYDTDPAIRAAGLTGALANELSLAALTPGPSYLTSDRRIVQPLLSAFRVLAELPLREKVLAQHLREQGVGRLEIKKRGVDLDPEKLRSRLAMRGTGAATLLLTRQGVREIAVLAERCDVP